MTEYVLPDCSDDQLLGELAAVVSFGWRLPELPQHAALVRNLMTVSDVAPSASYATRARRFLVLLDEALSSTVLVRGEETRLSEDDEWGLRVLFGTSREHRNQPSPNARRADASEYLVPGWSLRPPKNRAEAFLRRHQERVLAIALEHLRAYFGQRRWRTLANMELVHQERWWKFGSNRVVELLGDMEVHRSRLDGLAVIGIREQRHAETVLASDLRMLPHTVGPEARLDRIEEDHPREPEHRVLVFELTEPVLAGDLFSFAWEERQEHAPATRGPVDNWVSVQAPTGGFLLDMSVAFAKPQPELVWAFDVDAAVDQSRIPAEHGVLLPLDAKGTAHYQWADTQPRQEYCIKWSWSV